jgi:sodium transport system permease protein
VSKVLLKYELLALLRDTRTIFLSVLLPIILLPILLFTLNRFGQRATGNLDDTYHFGRAFPSPGLEVLTDGSLDRKLYREMLVDNGEQMLEEGHLDILIRVAQPDERDEKLASDIKMMFPGLEPLISEETPGQPVVEILYRSDRERSVRAYLRASQDLSKFRDEIVALYLERNEADVGIEMVAEDVSTQQERAARRYGPALSAFMVLMLLGGGSVAALDSLAGERERGTLSTLFVSSMDRKDIAWSKFLAVAIISVAVAVLQILNLAVYAALGFIEWPLGSSFPGGFWGFVALLLLFSVEAIFTASLLLYISARSSSFKEAQLFFFPTFLVAFALSLAGLMPALVSRSVVSLIPLTGPGVLIPEILAGRLDLFSLTLQCAVHIAASYFLIQSTLARMEREDFLGGQPPLHGAALRFDHFSQRALPYFAFLGAALFVVPSNFEVLMSLQGQGLFNQLVLFGIGPYLLVRYYGQDIKKVVPFKMVDPKILVASLLLIPLGQLAATGLSHLLGPLLPAPVKALEMMMELLDLANTPAWQLFLLIGVLPGICEEFAFRGVLLNALHKRFSPWTLAFVVALVFGLFHVNFFRVFPTAYLGFIMALLTLATGSVLPAMIVHIGNNSFAVWAMMNQMDFEGLPEWTYLVGFLGQITFVALVIRWGKGYPGTRWERN